MEQPSAPPSLRFAQKSGRLARTKDREQSHAYRTEFQRDRALSSSFARISAGSNRDAKVLDGTGDHFAPGYPFN